MDLCTASTFMLCHMNYFVLQSVGNEHLAAYEVAKLPYNKTKNRFANIFPCEWTKGSPDDCGDCDWYIYTYHISDDFSRVKLQEIKGVEGSEYVNASYIDVCTMFIVMWSSDVHTLSGAHNKKEHPA